ncbi:MAG: methyltransferase domain-containing protein [Thiobacillus sp.]|nr:methyltransferase domain-containing protein [Thiobacillus sp.]
MDAQLEEIRDQQRQTWDTFSAGWKKWDALVQRWIAPVGEALIQGARLGPAAQVLDIAAGTGEPGLTAASRVPAGKVVITDLSDAMLEVAADNARQRGIENVETRQCDAGALPFGDNSFDAVMCRFGFMFFPDVRVSLDEMVRVAKPGARICAAVWGAPEKNPWATTIMRTIAANVALPPAAPGAPGLFRCAEPGLMARAYRQAGLGNVAENEISGVVEFADAAQYWTFMTEIAAPVVAGLTLADATTRDRIGQTVRDLAQQATREGKVRFGWSAVTICGER